MDLMPFINKAGCECLNESDEHGFDNCLRKDSTYLESDCDEQVRWRDLGEAFPAMVCSASLVLRACLLSVVLVLWVGVGGGGRVSIH